MSQAPKEVRGSEVVLPVGYAEMLGGLKAQVRQAQFRAYRVVNEQLIELYWNIGREILVQQDKQGWGSGVIARLAEDLRAEFPQMKGLLAEHSAVHARLRGSLERGGLNFPTPCGEIVLSQPK